jgi:hypothetical protein
MRHLNKKLVATTAATALLAALGAAVAQSNDAVDPMATPQQVEVNADGSGNHIYFFRDQGNSPETDPAAHLMLIKHEQPTPVAERTVTTTTTVAQATTQPDPVTTAMPSAADTSNTESTDTAAPAPVEAEPALAPKADRN